MSSLTRAFLHHTLPRIWQRRGLAARALWPLSQVYGWVWRRQQGPRPPQSSALLPVPVLVIGNVIAGGAGKTPTTMAVVQHFQARGIRVGVVSRGYGRDQTAPACVLVGTPPDNFAAAAACATWSSDARLCGDEPLLIHQHTGVPVSVCAQRTVAAQALLQAFPATRLIVCDDGLQHHALPRQGEICVMDERGIGNGWLLPAGPLREPWPRRTDMVLCTAPATQPVAFPPGQAVFTAVRSLHALARRADGTSHPLAQWAQQRQEVIALAGIAQPERFFRMLEQAGLTLAARHALPDHASSAELQALAQILAQATSPVLCTEKDAVKLWPSLPQAWSVPLALTPEPAFFTALDAWWQQQASCT